MKHNRVDTTLTLLATTLLAVKVAVAAVNLFAFPRLKPAGPHPARKDVSLLIPARDEAHNLRTHLPGLLAQGAGEVIVLDDGSADGTAGVARSLGARVIAGSPLPGGWLGKPWACWQLAAAAQGTRLVFTDADVAWHVGALDALLHEWDTSDAGLLSVFPRQANRTWGERLLTPLVDEVLLTLFPAPLLRVPHRAASAANGQVMAFTRAGYAAVGGHESVRHELLEDVKLAHRVKEGGGRLALALGGGLIGVRMYRDYPDSVRGFGKNWRAATGDSRPLLALAWAVCAAAYSWPWLRGHPLPVLLGLLEGVLVRAAAGRTRPNDLLEVALRPALPLLVLPVIARAGRTDVEGKARLYRQGAGK